jgi:2-(1,2-epoxy-1,2-dihydrophenyl)acetyl-CoA isomerase
MAYEYETLATSVKDNILDLALNRPRVRNAISHQMQAEIDLALDQAETDPEVRAVILRGEGLMFTAGHDLGEQTGGKSFPNLTFPHAHPTISPRLPRAWYFRKPLIGAIHRFVGAYGLALAGCCDFNIAATGTRFSCEIFRLSGSAPDIGWLPLYLQLPMRVIEKLWLLGGWMDAEQALQFQFVQRVVPEGEVVEEARRWAEQAALIPTTGFAYSKDQIRRSVELLGLNSLHAALSRDRPPSSGEAEAFGALVQEKGLKAALLERDAKFDPAVARV